MFKGSRIFWSILVQVWADPSIPFWEGPAISGNALPRALERLYGDTINSDGIPALERLFLNKSALNILKSWPVATTKPHLAMIHIWLWWDQWCRSFDALILLIRSSIFHSFGPACHCSNTMQNVFAEILYKRRYMLPPGTPPTSCWIFFKRLPWCSRIMYNKVYKVWWSLLDLRTSHKLALSCEGSVGSLILS